MNFRIKWMLIGALAMPGLLVISAVLGYYGSIYPQTIPASLIERALWLTPLLLLPLAIGGAWMGWKLADKPRQEKIEVLVAATTYIGSFIVMDCLWRRSGALPDDELSQGAINFGNSMVALVICFAVLAKRKRTHQ